MGVAFLIRRFALSLTLAFIAIALGQVLLRGRPLEVALPHALAWGILAASIYTGALLYRLRQNPHCQAQDAAPR